MTRTAALEKELERIWQEFITIHPNAGEWGSAWHARYIRAHIMLVIRRLRIKLEIPTPLKWWTRYALPYVWSGKVVIAPGDRGSVAIQLNP